MDSVLLVHESVDLHAVVGRLLRKELGDGLDLTVKSAFDMSAYADVTEARYRLAVLGAAAPGKAGDMPDNFNHSAAKAYFIEAFARRPDLAVLVLATENDDELCRIVARHPKGRLVIVSPGSDWRQVIRNCAREAFLGGQQPDSRRTKTVLRIELANHSQGQWSIERRGPVQVTQEGTLTLERVTFHDLCVKSEGLLSQFKSQNWGVCLPPVANDMYRMIFQSPANTALNQAFLEAVSDPKEIANIRMVFDLSADSYKLPVEALKRYEDATNAAQWYGLESAIVRQYEGEGPLEPLFWDAASRNRAVDCLLIAADPRTGMDLEPLDQVTNEIDDVAEVLEAQRKLGANIGKIEILKLEEQEKGPAQRRFSEMLASHPWKLVHFAGHAVIEPSRDDHPPSGNLVLSPADEVLLSFSAFARIIPDVQFLFVSSCRSAHQAFLQDVIRQSIPAVLGYRWPVIDSQARELAVDFYRALFTPNGPAYKSLGRALAFARKQVFGLYLADVTWASPDCSRRAAG